MQSQLPEGFILIENSPTAWLPPVDVWIAIMILGIASSELGDWVKARENGFRGSSKIFGQFIDWTFWASGFCGFAAIISIGFAFGWRSAIGVFFLSIIALFSWNVFLIQLSKIKASELKRVRITMWMFALAVVWPMLLYLVMRIF